MKPILGALALALMGAGIVLGGQADVEQVKISLQRDGRYRLDVTVRHADQGWDHYADRWEVIAPDGTLLGTRVLHHPHVNEQPFTRSLADVPIPANVDQVTIRAHDCQHGYGGKQNTASVPR